MASLHERMDQLPQAMRAIEQALRAAPHDRRSRLLRAAILERMGKDDEAEEAFRALVEADPTDPDANNALSYFYATRGRNLEEARRLVDRALEAEPENGAFLDTLGWVLYAQGHYAAALEALKRAAEAIKELDPEGDAVVLDHLGDAHEKLKQYPEARRAWQRALERYEIDRNPEINPEDVRRKLDRLPGRSP
jgi:Tfp pilus assembly protein PilF